MKSPRSANSTMSSKRSSISWWSMPRIRPFSMMFSRPVNSELNPAPSANSATSRPFTSTVPSVGCRMPETMLRSVLLPAPFRPMMPRVVPFSTSRFMSLRAQKSRPYFFLPKLRASFSRARPFGNVRKFLDTPFMETAGMSDQIREVVLDPVEHEQPDDEERRGKEREPEGRLEAGQLAVYDQVPVGVHQDGEWVVVHQKAPLFRHPPRGPEDRRDKERPADHGPQGLPYVGHVGAGHRHQVAQAQDEQHLGYQDQRQQQRGQVQLLPKRHEDDQERPHPEQVLDERRDYRRQREDLQRKNNALHQVVVALNDAHPPAQSLGVGQEG